MQSMDIQMELTAARAVNRERVLAEYRAYGQGRGPGVLAEMKIFALVGLRNGLIYRRRTFRRARGARSGPHA